MTGARRALVLGGGVAGLCAAFGLRDGGFQVTLLESHGWLGGRAFSFDDRSTGQRLDNGPHILLGCYRALRELLARIGSDRDFQIASSLSIAYRTAAGGAARLQLGRLPVPLSLPPALLRLPLRAGEKLRALRGLASVLRSTPAAWTVADWLRCRGQTGAPAAFLWEPLCRAIMNVAPDEAAARLFLRTLREAFGGAAAAAAFWVPRRPWGELIGDAALRGLRQEGVDVRLHARIGGVALSDGAVTALQLGDGAVVAAGGDVLVASALPWHALSGLVPAAAPFAGLGVAPLVSIYFHLVDDAAAPPDDGPITALVGGDPFHFLYRTPGAPRRRFALLAGGNRQLDGCSVAEVERRARAQLARHYPGFDQQAPAVVRVAKEARATFVAGPGAASLRPSPGRLPDGPRNLFVCGDWTDCGLPATLEGAARSAAAMLAAISGSWRGDA